ncbi:MAG: CCA tRNA nucleotidyltransferase, partial [Bdellovibrionales bacterium]
MVNAFPERLTPSEHPWLREEGLMRLWQTFEHEGATLRVVGGAVRDALLGRPVGDIDCAVDLPPDQASKILTAAGFKVIPTGL